MLQNAQKCRVIAAKAEQTPQNLLTMREVCSEARISLAQLYRMRKRGFGPRIIRLDGAVRVSRAEFSRWLSRHTETKPGKMPPAYANDGGWR